MEEQMFQRRVACAVIMLFVFALFYTWIEQAEARRLGGGRSFGSSPSYQRSAPQPSSPQKTQPSQTQPTPQSPAAAPRPFGGMLGGLLMALPFLDRSPERRFLRRWKIMLAAAAIATAILVLSSMAYFEHYGTPHP